MVVSVAAPLRATAAHQRSWVPLRESPTAYEVSRAASRALVRRQLAHPSSLEGASTEMPTINSETLTAFLSDLRLDSFEPLLARLPAGTFVGASGPPIGSTDLRRFVVAVARAAADNPQLVAMLRDCRSSVEVPSDEEVHRLVHYCLCLHLITKELAASPQLASEVESTSVTQTLTRALSLALALAPTLTLAMVVLTVALLTVAPMTTAPLTHYGRCWSTSATRCARRRTGGSTSRRSSTPS